jgi:hypothetical protein
MEQHVKILAVLHIVLGSLGILAASAILLIFGGVAGLVGVTDSSGDAHIAMPILALVGTIIFVALAVLSFPGLIAGIGLLQFQPWARILAIVLSILDLIHIPPFGILLGVYGLWVLFSPETERLFNRGAGSQPARAS